MANKRIVTELGQVSNNPVPGTSVQLAEEGNVFLWDVVMQGPEDSVYAVRNNANFKIEVSLPKEYPFKPPTVSFKTKIYHPNVTNDDKGSMCLGMLRSDQWKPPNKIRDVLILVRQILAAPQPDDAVESRIADEYKNNRETFDKNAKEFIAKYCK
ncbi:ubiquitin-conjugating enzyme [Aureobasidium subglaciale]|nr:ubiquitin-conjugating enzyme [Aureobasidium subglaciale]KAI5217942.1 ubiquitin-conjugating enzyme [Aureobasidium subglaciale]KAI5221411.1 ubiquitin-conjugating enzyme [Aureobasidium subglaciale]KAI5239118.1 ubiquitin-conjugating enzyme [Aureobasidium subglaciale]KAI5258994.1 ubiquitin-conjugating enzyme [Aureobasidium subglaciale]